MTSYHLGIRMVPHCKYRDLSYVQLVESPNFSVTGTQIYYSDSTERRGHRAKTQIKVKQLYFEAYQKIAIGEGDAIA